MMGSMLHLPKGATPETVTENIFEEFDSNHDGQITLEEFMSSAREHPSIVRMLQCEPNDSTSWPHGEGSVTADLEPELVKVRHHGGIENLDHHFGLEDDD